MARPQPAETLRLSKPYFFIVFGQYFLTSESEVLVHESIPTFCCLGLGERLAGSGAEATAGAEATPGAEATAGTKATAGAESVAGAISELGGSGLELTDVTDKPHGTWLSRRL